MPSKAHRWVSCPGSVTLEASYPQPSGQPAIEGTAAHWAMAEMLGNRLVADGQITPAGTILTDEMIESAEVMVDDVRKVLAGQQLSMFAVEQRVSMERRIHPQNWGTPDVRAYSAASRTLWVWDFKHGHEFVSEFENWQLVDYVAGVATECGLNGLDEQLTSVVMTVVQPRCYDAGGTVRRWIVKLSDLRAMFNQLEMSAEDALSGHAKTKAGPWCHRCNAAGACRTLQRDAYRSAAMAGESIPVDMPTDAAALELRMLEDAAKRLDSRITGLQAQIESTLRKGVPVAGWSLEASMPREKYTVPVESVIAMASLVGVDASKPGVMTPPQLRKAGVPAEVVASISTRPGGEMRLARSDDPRMRRIFDGFVK